MNAARRPWAPWRWVGLALRRTLSPAFVALSLVVLFLLARVHRGDGPGSGALDRQALWIGAVALLAPALLTRAAASFGRERWSEVELLLRRPASHASLVAGEFLGLAGAVALWLAAVAAAAEWSAPEPLASQQVEALRLLPAPLESGAGGARLQVDGGAVLDGVDGSERLRLRFATLPGTAGPASAGELSVSAVRGVARTEVRRPVTLGWLELELAVPAGEGPLFLEIEQSGSSPQRLVPMTDATLVRPLGTRGPAVVALVAQVGLALAPWLALALAFGVWLSPGTAAMLTFSLWLFAQQHAASTGLFSGSALTGTLAGIGRDVAPAFPSATAALAGLAWVAAALALATHGVSNALGRGR